MYRVLPLLLGVFLFGHCIAQETDWEANQLKGKVRSFTHLENYRYKRTGQRTDWEILYNKKYSFDHAGRYTETATLNPAGGTSYKITYTYDKKANAATIRYIDKDEDQTKQNQWIYNDKGQRITNQEYTKDNQPDWRYTYTYDSKGNKATMESYRPDGSLYSKTTYTYDANGYESGYLLKTTGYANSGRSYINDSKGNKTEEIWLNGKNEANFRFVRTYDSNGNVTEELKYKGRDRLLDKTSWKYEYDKKNNWIKRTQYSSDGVEYDITERKIVYY
ncbi:DUF3836 domain-containing protein [Ferruginibacter sp. HRS2-29]|uniref:DUF3836 domain-containing protein n=1 Tax=Ferruginibacter sp. HRS2-29 TaxID=2487334 RepID=UPI0020CED688|nr:DUF3836 domain-containing protein [Ferruginibacter sp. HRS2-29]MCP9752727.1 hypothetical protein [Ferruginibacter sp. HRS2-29]